MKTLKLFTLLACFTAFSFVNQASAQIELKINPIGILFNSPDVAAEFLLSENFGVEGRIGVNWNKWDFGGEEYKSNGFQLIGSGKYYFRPDGGCDKFYLGAYLKFATSNSSSTVSDDFNNTRIALGPVIGYKWLAASEKVAFELGFGVGRAFLNSWSDDATDDFINSTPLGDIDFVGTLAVGYRFGG